MIAAHGLQLMIMEGNTEMDESAAPRVFIQSEDFLLLLCVCVCFVVPPQHSSKHLSPAGGATSANACHEYFCLHYPCHRCSPGTHAVHHNYVI